MPRSLPDLWGTVYRSSPRVSPPPVPRRDIATLSRLYGAAGAQTESYLRSLGVTPTPQPISDEGSHRRILSVSGLTGRNTVYINNTVIDSINRLSFSVDEIGRSTEGVAQAIRNMHVRSYGYSFEAYGDSHAVTVNPPANTRISTYRTPELDPSYYFPNSI